MKSIEKKFKMPGRKVLSYINKMITDGNWKVNEIIPSINDISKKTGVSTYTTKQVLKSLEKYKIVGNYGKLGYIVTSDYLLQLDKIDTVQFLLKSALFNINLSKVYKDNMILIPPYGISFNKKSKRINAFNVITSEKISCSLDDIRFTLYNAITIDQLLNEKDQDAFKLLRKEYIKQSKLSKLSKVIKINKKKLGIDL